MTNVRDWLLEWVENLIVSFDKPGKNQRDQMGINGMRNLFENNWKGEDENLPPIPGTKAVQVFHNGTVIGTGETDEYGIILTITLNADGVRLMGSRIPLRTVDL